MTKNKKLLIISIISFIIIILFIIINYNTKECYTITEYYNMSNEIKQLKNTKDINKLDKAIEQIEKNSPSLTIADNLVRAGGNYVLEKELKDRIDTYVLCGKEIHIIKRDKEGNTLENIWYESDTKLVDWISSIYDDLPSKDK